jgi:hypothetical protein
MPQSLHALRDPDLYGITPGSREEAAVFSEVTREVRMLSGLHHAKIVSFRGVVLDSGTGLLKYLVLELAFGSLTAFLRSLGRPLSLDELHRMSDDVFDGLSYLHGLVPAVVHRDLKTDNLLAFVSGGGAVTVKIGDVGLARFAASATQKMTVGAGTVYYMAPEVLMGASDYGVKADVFSVGVILAEVVTGYVMPRPAGSDPSRCTDIGVRASIIRGAVEYLRSLGSPLADVVENCCVPDPALRWSASQSLSWVRGVSIDVSDAVRAAVAPAPALPVSLPALVTVLTQSGIDDGIAEAVVATVESTKSITVDGVVEVLKANGLSTLKAVRIRNLLTGELAPEAALAGPRPVMVPAQAPQRKQRRERGERSAKGASAVFPNHRALAALEAAGLSAFAGPVLTHVHSKDEISVEDVKTIAAAVGMAARDRKKWKDALLGSAGSPVADSVEVGVFRASHDTHRVALALPTPGVSGVPWLFPVFLVNRVSLYLPGVWRFCVSVQASLASSVILSTLSRPRQDDFLTNLSLWLPSCMFGLLYRGSHHGLSPAMFHAYCDGKGPTLTLIQGQSADHPVCVCLVGTPVPRGKSVAGMRMAWIPSCSPSQTRSTMTS